MARKTSGLNDGIALPAAVDKFMEDLKHPLHDVAQRLRELILGVDKNIGEGIFWNAPTFYYTGRMEPFDPKSYKRYIVGFNFFKQDRIRLIFLHGATIADGTGLLEGDYTDGRRLAQFESLEDVERKEKDLKKVLKALIKTIHDQRNPIMISDPKIITTKEQPSAVIPLVIPGRDMPKYMDPAIKEILKVLADQNVRPAGPMFSYHHRRPSDTFDFEMGFPVAKVIGPAARVINSKLPSVKVARAVYQGPYEGLAQAWSALQKWVRENGHGDTGKFWESYLNNPDEVKSPNEYRTELNWVISEQYRR
jgi:effector-binding domain-containing protein